MNITRGVVAAAIVVGSGSAFAADMMPRKAPAPVESVYSWTGLYLGVNVGLSAGDIGTRYNIQSAPVATPSFDAGTLGVIGGGQIGYNLQMGDWVFGLEADIQASSAGSSANCVLTCSVANRLSVTNDLPWFGTVRGRVGTPMGGLLFYYTGGLAFGNVETKISETIGGASGATSFSNTRTGWTVGSGVEAALGGNWVGRVEYLFVDFGKDTNAYTIGGVPHTIETNVKQNIVRVGASYRFGAPAAPPSMLATRNWAGLYAGGNFGNGVAHSDTTFRSGAVAESFDISPKGWLGGGQIGYNWQAANWVLGIEADLQWNGQDSKLTCALGCSNLGRAYIKQELPWFGTVRGRLGYGVGQALFYATGGLAYGKVEHEILQGLPGFAEAKIETSENRTGYVVGAGVETPMSPIFNWTFPNWTVRTEYLFIDMGTVTSNYVYGGVNNTLTTDIQNHVFRSVWSYKFSGL